MISEHYSKLLGAVCFLILAACAQEPAALQNGDSVLLDIRLETAAGALESQLTVSIGEETELPAVGHYRIMVLPTVKTQPTFFGQTEQRVWWEIIQYDRTDPDAVPRREFGFGSTVGSTISGEYSFLDLNGHFTEDRHLKISMTPHWLQQWVSRLEL